MILDQWVIQGETTLDGRTGFGRNTTSFFAGVHPAILGIHDYEHRNPSFKQVNAKSLVVVTIGDDESARPSCINIVEM